MNFTKKTGIFFLFMWSVFCNTVLFAVPPHADLLLTGNLQGKVERKQISYIASHNPYSIWFIGGNIYDIGEFAGKNAPLSPEEKKSIFQSRKSYQKNFSSFPLYLSLLGREDFQLGLHGAVISHRRLRYSGVWILDYIGARNNENPYLLKYIDILVNGKSLRFIGLGAWERLLPAKKDILYRKITSSVIREIKEYVKGLKKVDFTILATAQDLKYDKILAENPDVREIFDLILSHDPSCPLIVEKKNAVPVAGCGKHASELRKVYFNPGKEGIGGPKVQVWLDTKYTELFSKKETIQPTHKKKTQEKKKK